MTEIHGGNMVRNPILQAMVLLLVLLPVAAFGQARSRDQSQMGFYSLGAHLGWVDPENLDSALGIGLLADFGPMIPDLRLEGNLDFWSESKSFVSLKESFRDISLGATAKYYFPVGNSYFKPFAGGGLALHMLRTKVEYPEPLDPFGTISASDTKTRLGLDLTGGTLYEVSEAVDLLGEFRYRIVSDFSQTALRVGIVYNFQQQ